MSSSDDDRGFLATLLVLAVGALLYLHLRATAFPVPRAGVHRGCTSCHNTLDDHPALSSHPFDKREAHRVLAKCTDCHGGDANAHAQNAAHAGLLHGKTQQLQCMKCHTPRQSIALNTGRAHWAVARCGACHRDFRVPGERKGPAVDQLDDKLTREFLFTYLSAPASFDAHAPFGPHGVASRVGDEADPSELQAKALALTAYLLDGARTRKSDAWPVPRGGKESPDLRACLRCHRSDAFEAQGTKTNAAWLKKFLREHTRLPPPAVDRLAMSLAAQTHPTFESRWPVMNPALDAALRRLAAAYAVAEVGALESWVKPLGQALFVNEGCGHCHDKKSVQAPASIAIHQAAAPADTTHKALSGDAELRHYVDALLIWEHERIVDLAH